MRRPALRRILRSTQIDALAKTSMEFIEGEKNFNKILCRLSAIMHLDDPRYLDLTFDRTVEQRKKYKQDIEAAKAAAETLSSAAASTSDVVDDLDPKELDREVEATVKKDAMEIVEEDGTTTTATTTTTLTTDIEGDVDVEAQEVVRKVKELILVHFTL